MALGAFLGLDIGRKGIFAAQKALNVVGNNISNAQTEGYTRQRVVLKASKSLNDTNGGQIGTGVQVEEIERIRDSFLDVQIRDQLSFKGEIEALSQGLTQLQAVLNEPSDTNIRNSIDVFFASLEDVNNQPENSSIRVTTIERAKSLSTLINVTAKRLSTELESTNQAITRNVEKVNSIGKSLSTMNLDIAKIQNVGQNPNDILDQRDLLLDQLSELVNVDITKDKNGVLTARVGSHLLVQGAKFNSLKLIADPRNAGKLTISSTSSIRPNSSSLKVASAEVGAHARNQQFTLTVFETATDHRLQSEAFLDIKQTMTDTSTLASIGVTTGSVFLNGSQIFFNNDITVNDLVEKINSAGTGTQAFFERGRLQLKAVKSGTANQMVLSEGTSNLLNVFRFSDKKEIDGLGQVVFDGEVRDAKYAYNKQTFNSSSNYIEDIVEGIDVTLKGVGSTTILANSNIRSGKIQGLMVYQDQFVQGELDSLDKMSYALIKEFNKIHYDGFGSDGQSQRLFFQDFNSSHLTRVEIGASRNIAVSDTVANNVKAIAAASGIFEKNGDRIPISSGIGDGTNALRLAQLKFAKIVENTEYGLSTRLSVLNAGNGVDLGREESYFGISDGEKTAIVSLQYFDEDATIFDLQNQMNDALEKNGIDTRVILNAQADGGLKITSTNKAITFQEGAGTLGDDLRVISSAGASGNGTRVIETVGLNSKFRGDPKSLSDFFASTVANIGVKAEETIRLRNNTEVVFTQLETERQSVMGVSIDEELTNMIQFQQGFNASARIISMVNEMLTQIVNIGN
ncbi:MAG: flagellar hook-associated protein FlgK [Candidatus Cloacimonadota bacterium]|nr:MAG: flagellar hook-associated protein FlgK [Candidatus Cloacimonadota bacterium]